MKNFTLHRINIAENLEDDVEVVEPKVDKSELVLDVDNIDGEFDRILELVCPHIHCGDSIIVGGHPLICQAVITACMIKGAIPYMTKINEYKQVFYLYRVKTYFDIDRKKRIELENTDII